MYSALELAQSLDEPGVIVTILCDSGVKYLSKIFNDSWMENRLQRRRVVEWSEFRVGSLGQNTVHHVLHTNNS